MKKITSTLPPISQKKFDAKKFNKIASEVAIIIKNEQRQAREDILKEINENNYSRRFSL